MNFFTPDDFKNKDGEYASPEAAAKIANEKLELFFEECAKSLQEKRPVRLMSPAWQGFLEEVRCGSIHSVDLPDDEVRTKNIWEKLTKIF